LQIESVKVGETEQDFDYDGEHLHIQLAKATTAGQAMEVAIAYSVCKPQRGIYFIGPDKHCGAIGGLSKMKTSSDALQLIL